MDLPRYGVWNPYTVAARGTVQEGQGVTFTIQLPRATRFVHYIKTLRLIPEREWVYRARWLNLPGLLFSEHCIQLIPEPDGKTRVVHRGFYTGILVPLFWRWFTADRIVQGTIMEDAALKRAAEGEGAVEREAPVIEQFGNRDRAALARMRGSWALVTGASSGIGREYAIQLAAAGLHLVMVARREPLLRELAHTLEAAHGINTLVVPLDLTLPEAPERLVQRVREKGIRLRLLANVAGVDAWSYFEEASLPFYRGMLRLNAEVPMALCHLFREDLASHLTSSIINVSSLAAFTPVSYIAVYGAAKAFLQSFSQALFGEFILQGIHVQTLVAGPTETNIAAYKPLQEHGVFSKGQLPSEVVALSLSQLASRVPVTFAARQPFLHRVFGALLPGRVVIVTIARRFRPPRSAGPVERDNPPKESR